MQGDTGWFRQRLRMDGTLFRKPLKTLKERKSDAWLWCSALTRTAAWGAGAEVGGWRGRLHNSLDKR